MLMHITVVVVRKQVESLDKDQTQELKALRKCYKPELCNVSEKGDCM